MWSLFFKDRSKSVFLLYRMSCMEIFPIIQSHTKSSTKKMVIIRLFQDRITSKDVSEFAQQVHMLLDRLASKYLLKTTGRNVFDKAEKEIPYIYIKKSTEDRFVE